MAAHALHASRDPRETTSKARQAFRDRFIKMVDPELVLQPAERERRAQSAMTAHMLKLSMRSREVRKDRQRTRPTSRPTAEEE